MRLKTFAFAFGVLFVAAAAYPSVAISDAGQISGLTFTFPGTFAYVAIYFTGVDSTGQAVTHRLVGSAFGSTSPGHLDFNANMETYPYLTNTNGTYVVGSYMTGADATGDTSSVEKYTFYRTAANDAFGTLGHWSLDPAAPGAPSNLVASPGDAHATLTWSRSSSGSAVITSYRVFRGTTSLNRAIVTSGACASLGVVLSCTDTGLANGQSYDYVVAAVNSVGQGAASNSANATPIAAVAIPTANFTWSPSSPKAAQQVQFTDTSTGSPTSWSWTFGDGATASSQNPSHLFVTAGSYSVKLTATNAGGPGSTTQTVTVAAASPVITSFVATPPSITSGQSSTLSWTTNNATSVSISGFSGTQPASGATPVSPIATTTYTLTATGVGGTSTATATVTVNPIAPAVVIGSFAANPSTITTGQSSTLSWTTTNATTVSISGVNGAQLASGSVLVSPSATTTYTLTASGIGTPATATTTVVVNAAPQPPGALTLLGNAYCSTGPTPAVLLTWGASSGVATYTLYRNGAPISESGTNMPASQLSFDDNSNVTAGTSISYFVRATNGNGSTDSNPISVVVPSNVCLGTQPPVINLTASPDRLVAGGSTTLSWSVSNASTVFIDNDLGARAASGSVIVNVARTTQYILTAVGPGGSAFRALTVRVDSPTQVAIHVTPTQGVAPFTSTLQAIAGGGVPPYTYTWSTGAHGAQTTALWTAEGRYGVYCTVIDSRGNQATSPTQVVSVTTLGVSATLDTYDPNPGITGNMVTSNPAVLTKAPKATMVAADGVTLLLLRFTSAVPGSVKYTIGGDTCDAATFTRTDDGGLSAWGAEDRLDSITQHTIAVGSQHQAFGVYHAPTDFARTAADDNLRYRPLTLRAQFTPDSGATSTLCTALQITRPPLVLIHGIWSDQYTWTLPLIGDNRFRIQPVSWDGYTSIANNQNTAYYAGVWPALSDARAWGIAVTQVDVIGHSMGGLLARAWAGGASYKRADNYSKGDYHKVITLNTPHIGSPLATKIISLRSEIGAPFVYGCQLLQKPISPCPASQIVGFFWNATCGPGAIDDLQKNSSVLRALPVPDVPTHAFVGEAGVLRAGGCLTALSALAKAVSIFHNLGDVDALSMDAFGETTHDQLVGSVSQGGGLGNSAISISQSCDSAHTKATTSSDYSTKIIALLNKKASDPAFGRINVNQMLQASDDRASTTTYRAVAAAVSSMTVTITSPADGALVDGASPLEVLVSVSGGIARMVTLLGDRIVLDKSDLPYQFTVNLPEDALGNESLFAVAQGTDGSVAFSAPVSVKVRRNTTIDSLQLDATSRTLLFPGNNQLHVNATFSDGIIRDVTGPGLSTTYKSDDESIVSVSGTGVMTAKRPGVTVVTAHNGAAEAATFVLVVPAPGLKRRAVLP